MCLTLLTFSQKVFYQNIFHGGVTMGGYNVGWNSNDSGNFLLNIEPGSTIKSAYLFLGTWNNPDTTSVYLNGVQIKLGNYNSNVINSDFIFYNSTGGSNLINSNIYDITDLLNPTGLSSNTYTPPTNQMWFSGKYVEAYVLVIYENPNLSKIAFTTLLNTQNSDEINTYQTNEINIIDTTKEVGLALNTSVLCNDIFDGFFIQVENDTIGLIGGNDYNSIHDCTGSSGNFYFQNETLFGLGDDTANNSMSKYDVISNINNNILYNDYISIKTIFQDPINYPEGSGTNVLWQMFLMHSTPCDTFYTNVPKTVLACKGDSIQLNVTGGNEWEWEPEIGLSCTNCPNPYFTDTVCRWYTVRVWNNDSCSKVLPVRVEVVEKPLNPIVQISPSQCSDSSGAVNVQIQESSHLYSLNGGAPQSNATFNNLWSGNHSVAVIDTNGCTSETNITIAETYPMADFTASTLEGDLPLEVNFTNQSTGATDFIWYIHNDTLYSASPTYTFEQEGNFNATLVAYDTYLNCSDTANIQIFATFPFTVIAPSLFVKQDAPYQIYTSNVATLQYELYNSIGQQLYHHTLQPTQGLNDVWSPYNISRGIYLYRITAQDDEGNEKVFSGKIVVI